MDYTCKKCGHVGPQEDFARRTSGGPFNRKYDYSQCKPCAAALARAYRASRPGYDGTGELASVPPELRLRNSAIKHRVTDAKSRAASRATPHSITWQYALEVFEAQGGRCALSGIPLALEKGSPWTLSLDQIRPGEGYVVGNIQWLAWAVNRAKGDLSDEDFILMCRSVLKV